MLHARALEDLDLYRRGNATPTVFSLLNHTRTHGGYHRLLRLLRLEDAALPQVLARQEAVRYILQHREAFYMPVIQSDVDYVQRYLENTYTIFHPGNGMMFYGQVVINSLRFKHRYYFIQSGVRQCLQMLGQLDAFCKQAMEDDLPPLLQSLLQELQQLLAATNITEATRSKWQGSHAPLISLYKTDTLLRRDAQATIARLLEVYYELEALASMATAHATLGLHFPSFSQNGDILLEDLWHPLVTGCVANTISLSAATPMLLITGPNMAGKSTCMKSVGVACVLAYMGMGVPATKACLPVYDDVVTCMETADVAGTGQSYFYSEVLQVKEVALQLQSGRRILLLADELFRGTNVKDAHDCALLVLRGLLHHAGSAFIISTHIAELAQDMAPEPRCSTAYVDAQIADQRPVYTYKLQPGITAQRLGMVLLHQAGVPQALGV